MQEHYYDRATNLTVYTKKRVLTRTGKYKNVWTATVCGKEYRATTLKMCRVLVSEALEQLAMGNLTWFVMNPVEA